jgi:hypothetical protein
VGASAVTALATYYATKRSVLSKTTNHPSTIQFTNARDKALPVNPNHKALSPPRGAAASAAAAPSASASDVPLLPHEHEKRMLQRFEQRETIERQNLTPRDYVKVRVPASSANMGPGFDCLGAAVDMWTEVEVFRAPAFGIEARGDGADQMPRDGSNYVVVGLEAAFKAAGKEVPSLK